MGTRRAVVVWVKKMGRASIIIAPHWCVDWFMFMDMRMVWNARQVAWKGWRHPITSSFLYPHNSTTLGLYLSIDHLLLLCKPPRCPKGATIHLQTWRPSRCLSSQSRGTTLTSAWLLCLVPLSYLNPR